MQVLAKKLRALARMTDREPRVAMADRIYGPPPKIFLGGSPAGEYPTRASGDEGELDETNSRGCSESASSNSLGRSDGSASRERFGGSDSRGRSVELDVTSGDEDALGRTSGESCEHLQGDGTGGRWRGVGTGGRWRGAGTGGRWRGAGTGGRSGSAELDGSSVEEGELNRISGGIGELDGTSGGIGELDRTSGGIGELDGTSGGIGELDGTSGGIGELDGTSGGIAIIAGGSRLMIPGHPSRGTKISRRLILGGLFCHDWVQEVARKSQETRNEETKNFF